MTRLIKKKSCVLRSLPNDTETPDQLKYSLKQVYAFAFVSLPVNHIRTGECA